MTAPVTAKRVQIAKDFGLVNVDAAAAACRDAGLAFFVACALLEKESGGKNVWGGDKGSVNEHLHGKPVTALNFAQFLAKVLNGAVPNGCGPAQITYAGPRVSGHRDGGYFRQMLEQGLAPWEPAANMRFGFGLLKSHYDAKGSWEAAGTAYNGAREYGIDLDRKVTEWRTRLGIK